VTFVGDFALDQWRHTLVLDPTPCGGGDDARRFPSQYKRIAARQVSMFQPMSYPGVDLPLDLTQYVGLYQPGGAREFFAEVRALLGTCDDFPENLEKHVAWSIYAERFAGDDSIIIVHQFWVEPFVPSEPVELLYTALIRDGDVVLGLSVRAKQATPGAADPALAAALRALSVQFLARSPVYLLR